MGEAKGRFMIFFQQPEQRLLSHYYFSRANARRGSKEQRTYLKDLKAMKTYCSGTATKMLTRRGKQVCSAPPTRAEVNQARIRLRIGFSFVGITEMWNLSICLFN